MFPWIAAFLLGALTPALIVAGFSASLKLLPVAFGITLGHSIILGLPLALWFRAKQWKRLSAALLGAALIGAIPIGLFAWPINPPAKSASVGGVATIIDGVPTLAGWLGYLQLLGMFGALGAAGGLVFWLTLRWSSVLKVDPATPALRQRRVSIWLAGAAITASLTVFALPSITVDRSCHNMFRDGRSSASTKANIDLDIAAADRPRLAGLLEAFGVSHGMSFRDSSENRPGIVDVLSLSACTEEGVVIFIHEQYWAAPEYAALRGDRGVAISVYGLHEGTGWQSLKRELVAALSEKWQGKVRFRDGGGRLVAGPAELMPQSGSSPGR